ncbi:MAG TPA: sialidase family protein, partial [Candidatus Thermoplasmatota archaeon]|nr:sialidase family protein [Candidatus Thermoplasmatota archaeon]
TDWTIEVWSDRAPSPISFEVVLEVSVTPAGRPATVTYQTGRTIPPTSDVEDLAIDVHPAGRATREPSLGSTSQGVLFTNEFQGILRSMDGGQSWRFLRPDVSAGELDADPWVWADPITDRVFRLSLQLGCSWLDISDDLGETWTAQPLGGCGKPVHHYQKLTTGPPPAGVGTRGYPNVVYYVSAELLPHPLSANPLAGGTRTWITRSLDGGATWEPGQELHPLRPGCAVFAGPVVVDASGTAYNAAQYCDGYRIAISRDGGRSWSEDAVLSLDGPRFGGILGPDMAVDSEGGAYVVHPGDAGRLTLNYRDPRTGQWSAPIDATPPGLQATTFPVIEAGEPGRVAIAFLGTTSDPDGWPTPNPSFATDDASWHLHIVLATDAFEAGARFTSYQVTPDHDPVQRGCIWQEGPAAEEPCRNLQDFIDMRQLDDRIVVAFVDGCIECLDAASSRGAWLHLLEARGSLLSS